MRRELAVDLVICGVGFAAVSVLIRYLRPDFPVVALAAGLAGGGLCLLWGVLGWWGMDCRRSALVTLVFMAVLLIIQAAGSWQRAAVVDSTGRRVAALMFVLLTLDLGMLWTLARSDKQPPP